MNSQKQSYSLSGRVLVLARGLCLLMAMIFSSCQCMPVAPIAIPTGPDSPTPLMNGAKTFLSGLSVYEAYPFGLDRPLLDFDVKRHDEAVLKFFLGIKHSPSPKLVLVGPALKNLPNMTKSALRELVFKNSNVPKLQFLLISKKELQDASFETTSSSNLYDESQLFSKVGNFVELELYNPADHISDKSFEVSEPEIKAEKLKWEHEIDNYKVLSKLTFKKIDELDASVRFEDLDYKIISAKQFYGEPVEKLKKILSGFFSGKTDEHPYSFFALLDSTLNQEEYEYLLQEPFIEEDLLLAKYILNKVTEQVARLSSFCEKRKNNKYQQLLIEEDDDKRAKLETFSNIYDLLCEENANKFLGRLATIENDMIDKPLKDMGVVVDSTANIYAERASSVYRRLLGIKRPRPPRPIIDKPYEEMPSEPPVVAPPPPSFEKPTPKPPPAVVSDLQKDTNELARSIRFLSSLKIPYGYDARPEAAALNEESKILSFYVGVLGSGPKKENAPFKLYLVGPKLVGTDGLPLPVNENYQLFFDDQQQLIYPVAHIEQVKEENQTKQIEHAGKRINVAQITALPAPQSVELFQMDDAADIKVRDAQIERLKMLTERIETNYPLKDIAQFVEKFKQEFGKINVKLPTFVSDLEAANKMLLAEITESDESSTPAQTWPKRNLVNMLIELEKDSDINSLLSKKAQDEAELALALTKLRLHQIHEMCIEISDERNAAKPEMLRISYENTLNTFFNLGCPLSVDDKKKKVTSLSVKDAESCLAHIVDRICLTPLLALTDDGIGKRIKDLIAKQTTTIQQAEDKNRHVEAMLNLFKSLVEEYEDRRPGQSAEELLKARLFQIRTAVEEDEDEESQEFED